ncbi:MAG TPA: 1,2-phenylacetyl-CoA epoxidase subunit PaaC, partial [Acidimicrobiales bacterium]|nr:1,2-phenylacetyl-CoA epoxidase subunit PaaC [Acidimicrobiales bacterium]
MGFDTAYEAVSEDDGGDERWAYGTGFSDPLAGVDTTVPDGVDGAALAAYCLMLGDDALIASHRLQEWLTHAPELEEETAIANVALDLLGQTRLLFGRAGAADGSGRSEDDYAFLRDEADFRNVTLVEAADEDFAGLVVRLAVFSTWRLALLSRLVASRDPVLAAVAAKGVKELTYHRDWAARWVVALGDGTDQSRERVVAALAAVVPSLPELYEGTDVESRLAAAGVAVDPSDTRAEVEAVLGQIAAEAGLAWPAAPDTSTAALR